MYNIFLLFVLIFTLSSCATLQPDKIPMNINLITLNANQEPIDAVCNLYSSSSKLDVLAPKEFIFMSHCSSINIVCKSGNLSGEHGIISVQDSSAQENFILNSTIGYLFDRAVDTVTPVGSLMNLFGDDDENCVTDRKITIVLE